jgi:hypothetical protein
MSFALRCQNVWRRGTPARRLTDSCVSLLVGIACCSGAVAFDINGVGLGSKEADAKRSYPSIRCKPLEWKSEAADRRCDDASISVNGIDARITYYLKDDHVRGLELRFETRDLDRMVATLESRFGPPQAKSRDQLQKKGGPVREQVRLRWERGPDHATLVAQLDRRRASLSVAQGAFDEALYRIR